MATGTALVLVAATAVLHYRARPRAALPRLAVPVAGFAVVVIAALSAGPFHDRLFRNTVTHAPVVAAVPGRAAQGDAEFNDGDRPLFWAHVARSASESPIFGKGIGSSQAVMNERWPSVGHPHNDYLRVWHDLGLVGFAALIASFVTWARALARDWRQGTDDGEYAEAEGAPAQLELAGLLALVALVLPMVTDNALVYPFVVGPVGVLVGAGLGARAVGGTGRRQGAVPAVPNSAPNMTPNAAPANPLDARWTWEPKYPVRRRRRRA